MWWFHCFFVVNLWDLVQFFLHLCGLLRRVYQIFPRCPLRPGPMDPVPGGLHSTPLSFNIYDVYSTYLILFLSGLLCEKFPYSHMARQYLLEKGSMLWFWCETIIHNLKSGVYRIKPSPTTMQCNQIMYTHSYRSPLYWKGFLLQSSRLLANLPTFQLLCNTHLCTEVMIYIVGVGHVYHVSPKVVYLTYPMFIVVH